MKKLIFGTITASLMVLQTLTSPAEDVLFERDLTNTRDFDFTYGSWVGNSKPSEEGLILAEGCDHSGGAGFYNLNLNLFDIPQEELFVVVEAKRLPTSTANLLGVLLVTTAGSDATGWQYPLPKISSEDFETIEFPLASKPSFVLANGLDFSKVIELQIQGDYTTPGEIGVVIKNIKIIKKN